MLSLATASPRMSVPGLQNLGNTCFFNAILQALASLPSVREYLQDISQHGRRSQFTGVLSDCLKALRPREEHLRCQVVSPLELNKELTTRLRSFRGNKQQDSQELLQSLFKLVLAEQRNSAVHDRGLLDLSIGDIGGFGAESCLRCHRYRPMSNQPFLDVTLSLIAPGDRKISRLTDALQVYTEPELISGVECGYCSVVDELEVTRKEYAKAAEKLALAEQSGTVVNVLEVNDLEIVQHERKDWLHRLEQLANSQQSFELDQLERPIPRSRGSCQKRLQFSCSLDVFCFHLNHKIYRKVGGAIKLETFVKFPEELDMSPYCQYGVGTNAGGKVPSVMGRQLGASSLLPLNRLATQGHLLYELNAVIFHHGNERSGHFTAYRRAGISQWFFISDDKVREAPVAEVLSSCAYMLFYERKFRSKRVSSETEETTDDESLVLSGPEV